MTKKQVLEWLDYLTSGSTWKMTDGEMLEHNRDLEICGAWLKYFENLEKEPESHKETIYGEW